MQVYNNVLEMIGGTPMVKINHLDTGKCDLYIKLESQNPGASVKDRIAVQMIADAEASGELKPGDTIIEATAGNTGMGLALVAAQKGYKLMIVMPDKMSMEKEYLLKGMGAEVIRCRSDVNKGHPEYYQDLAISLAEKHNAFYISQFTNQSNPKAHYMTTAPEIWEQMNGNVDAFVCGCGTGGTLSGVGKYLREKNSNVDLVVADPNGSILCDLITTGTAGEPGSWLVEGIGEDYVPETCNIELANKSYTITDAEAFKTARDLMQKEGLCVGSSTGVLVGAALKYCQEQTEAKTVVTLACDTGNRYLSKVFNEEWLQEKGLGEILSNES
jgi:cystathionine beta-synthase